MKTKQLFVLIGLLSTVVVFQNCGQAPTTVKTVTTSNTGGSSNSNNNTGASAPLAPSGLVLSAASSSQINLSWSDNSSNETGFKIERASGISGPFTTGMGAFFIVTTVGPNITQYKDMNLSASTMYYYRVSAMNSSTASSPTSVANLTTPAAPTSPPSPPSNLAVTASAATIATLSWSDNSNNESYFKIEKSTNNGTTFTLVATASADSRSYSDINQAPQSSAIYRVRASNSAGDSNPTANATVTLPASGNTATYTYISTNVIGPNCVDCHGPSLKAAGYDFSTYGSTFANRTAMINSINSGRMPPGAPLPAFQLNALNAWLNAGAPNN